MRQFFYLCAAAILLYSIAVHADNKEPEQSLPITEGRKVIVFDVEDHQIKMSSENSQRLLASIETMAQKNKDNQIIMTLNAYTTPENRQKSEQCVEALEDYIDDYLYQNNLVDEVEPPVDFAEMTDISRKYIRRRASHTIYVYGFDKICSDKKRGDLIQEEPGIKYLERKKEDLPDTQMKSYVVLDRLAAETCTDSLNLCNKNSYCLPDLIKAENTSASDIVYWKPNQETAYIRTRSENTDMAENNVTLSDHCVVTLGMCSGDDFECENSCMSLMLYNNDIGLYQSICETIRQKL